MESASTEIQNSYLDWTVFQCSKDSSVHSWLISWLSPAPLTRYFHWWIMAPYTNWMTDWLIDWLIEFAPCIARPSCCYCRVYIWFNRFNTTIHSWRYLHPIPLSIQRQLRPSNSSRSHHNTIFVIADWLFVYLPSHIFCILITSSESSSNNIFCRSRPCLSFRCSIA